MRRGIRLRERGEGEGNRRRGEMRRVMEVR